MNATEDFIGQEMAVYYLNRSFLLEDKAKIVLEIIKRAAILTEQEKRHVEALEKAINNR